MTEEWEQDFIDALDEYRDDGMKAIYLIKIKAIKEKIINEALQEVSK